MSKQRRAGIYLYGIIATPTRFDNRLKGIDGERVYLIKENTLSAVVTDAREDEYMLSRKNVLHHQAVIEQVRSTNDPILPVSFGTVAETEEAVKKLLAAHSYEFQAMLVKMAGKIEIGVKGIWIDRDDVIQKLAKRDERLLHIAAPDNPQQVTLEAAVKVGKLVEASLATERERLKNLIISKVSPLVDEIKETSLYAEEMIFNLAVLASKAKGKQIVKTLQTLAKHLEPEGVMMRISSETAPYDFIKLPIAARS